MIDITVLTAGATTPSFATAAITAGNFTVDVPIGSYEARTAIQVEMTTESDHLIGATPPFLPAFVFGFARVVMGAPSSCVLLSAPQLTGGRRLPGVVVTGGNLMSIGGELAGGTPVSIVEVLVPVHLTDDTYRTDLESVSPPFGRTRILPFRATTDLFVLGDDHAIRFETAARTDSTSPRARDRSLHSGAGGASAVVDLGARGIAVIGGQAGDAAVTTVTVVPTFETIEPYRYTLQTPRSGASAVPLGGGILVAGGQPEGQPLFEWLPLDPPYIPSTFGPTTTIHGGTLVLSTEDGGQTALFYLGEDGSGTASTASFVVTGCPSRCVASDAALFPFPRVNAASVARSTSTIVLGGMDAEGRPSAFVEEVRFMGGVPTLSMAGSLSAARADVTATPLGSDIVLVAGGVGAEGTPRDDLELCFPEELPRIALP